MDHKPHIADSEAKNLPPVPEPSHVGAFERVLDRLRPVGHAIDVASRRLRETRLGDRLHARHFAALALTEVEARVAGLGALDGLTIAWLSDLHVGPFMDPDDLERLFARVTDRGPDLVCLGGDMVTSERKEVELMVDALRQLKPPLGLLGVLGNHEYHDTSDYDVAKFLRRCGVDILLNEGRRIERDGASLWIAGVDDWLHGEPDVAAALDGRREGEPSLLLSHNPDVFPDAAHAGVDLTLSGHTHGGQIRIFGWAPVTNSRKRYCSGFYRQGRSALFIGRGAGTTVLPLRIGADPEVPIVTLRDAGGERT